MPDRKLSDGPAFANLTAVYGGPSSNGFGSAVFAERIGPDDGFERVSLRIYKRFAGQAWERFGEEAWLKTWREVYAGETGGQRDIIGGLRSIKDRETASAVEMILDTVEDADAGRSAVSGVFNDPLIDELRVYKLGDGAAMSGLLISANSRQSEEAVFLIFLMD